MSVQCWNDANYTGTTYTWGSNDGSIGSSMADQISSFKLKPWSKVVFFADSSYRGDSKTFINDSTTVFAVANMKTIAYDTNSGRSINDNVSSLQISSIAVPACAGAMDAYLARNPDVAAAGVNPWKHYAASGQNEQRFWPGVRCDGGPNACIAVGTAYKGLYPEVPGDPWTHYVNIGRGQNRAWPGVSCDGSAVQKDPAPYAAAMAATSAGLKQAYISAGATSYTSITVTATFPVAVPLGFWYAVNVVGTPTVYSEHIFVGSGTTTFSRIYTVNKASQYTVTLYTSTDDVNIPYAVQGVVGATTPDPENDTKNILMAQRLAPIFMTSTFSVVTIDAQIPATPLGYNWFINVAGPSSVSSGSLTGPAAAVPFVITNYKIGNLVPASSYTAALYFITATGPLTLFRTIAFTTLDPAVVKFNVQSGDVSIRTSFVLPNTVTPNALVVNVDGTVFKTLTSDLTSLSIPTKPSTSYVVSLMESSKPKLKSFTISTANGNLLNIAEIQFMNGDYVNVLTSTTLDLKFSTVSSTWDDNTAAYGLANSYDGKSSTITHTKAGDAAPKLTLALTVPAYVYSVVIVNRQDCCQERLTGATISYSDENGTNYALGTLPAVGSSIQIPIQ